MQIEVDFDVFKALTVRRTHEGHTYNDVLRDILGLGAKTVHHLQAQDIATGPAEIGRVAIGIVNGLSLKGTILPDGTLLRATYKGRLHTARIENGEWISEHGRKYTSPSAAAYAISNTNINGWRFWEAKRPSDAVWQKLETLSKGTS